MVVLNSDYWFAPSVAASPESGGNLHGYLMDQQIAWLEKTLGELERNKTIDHVFLTVHTPLFPNGGHVGDAMWYSGNNTPRATVAGKAGGEGHHRAARRPAHAHPEAPEGAGGAHRRRAQLQPDAPRRHGAHLPAERGTSRRWS